MFYFYIKAKKNSFKHDYLECVNWKKATNILLNDSIEATKLNMPLMIIMIGYLFISIIILNIFLKLLSIFPLDREKPINLFLTIKKAVFENLKTSAENLSNKLLCYLYFI